MASLRNQNINIRQGLANQNGINKPVLRKPLAEQPVIKQSLRPVAQKQEEKKAPVHPGKLPTLSSLKETLPVAKRQRVLEEIVRTAGKENGFLNNVRRRPEEVSDIYKDDLDNEALVVAYVEHIYAYFYHREVPRVRANYMDGMAVNARMRAILVDWIVSVVHKFKLCQDTLYLAVDIADRFLSIPTLDITKDELQLIGVTAMFIAAKFEEVYPPELDDYVFISDNACTKNQILETEMIIANALNFDFSRPCATHFLRRVCKAAHCLTEEYCLSKYILELSLLNIEFVELRPSLVGAAAVYLALVLKRGSTNTNWNTSMEYYSLYSEADVKPVALKLCNMVIGAPTSRQQSIYRKYSANKMYEVAMTAADLATEAEQQLK